MRPMKGVCKRPAKPEVTATIDIQSVSEDPCPSSDDLIRWAKAALEGQAAELSLRLVGEEEMAELNARYRHRQGPTNVLSFPFEAPQGVAPGFLGDVVVCAPVVRREAQGQGKAESAHWAHMIVHGILHLRGYDHLSVEEAEVMEAKERQILFCLGYQDPYLIEETNQS